MTNATAPKTPPPARPVPNGKPVAQPATPRSFTVGRGITRGASRYVFYGPGGIGKTTLAGLAPDPIFIDIEEGTRFMDVPRIVGINDFADLRACLQSDVFNGHKSVVIDSATKAEEWAKDYTLATVPNDKGKLINNIEAYGFGKGYQHLYDTYLLLLSDLDAQVRQGRNVILIAHDCVADVPNPAGEDFIRYEPHLQSPKSGKASIRNRVIQWADYVFFIGYDVVAEDGKGRGAGTRTIFTVEMPDHIAKSRTVIDPQVPFENANDNKIWNLVSEGGAE